MNYEEIRKKNIQDNARILQELGIYRPLINQRVVVKRHIRKPAAKRKREDEDWQPEAGDDQDSPAKPRGTVFQNKRRRSSRLQNLPAEDLKLKEPEEAEEQVKHKKAEPRPKSYGPIEGVEVGRTWDFRLQCSSDGIHRPTVAGIHGGPDGAYSLALSGGYEDDIDIGLSFTYTGEGGRDLKGTRTNPKNLRTAPQSRDQTLTRGNLALSRNLETGNPVRVIRGYKLDSPFAPEDCYRYDGLYTVEKKWYTTGMSGFMVWKFALKRLPDQAPPPWDIVSRGEKADCNTSSKDTTSEEEKENIDLNNNIEKE